MAFLQNLIVTGGSKFLNKIYATDIEVDGTFETSGNLSVGGTLNVIGNTTLKGITSTSISNNGSFVNHGGIELSHATPYIDFRFGKSTSDYTSRIIEEASGTITIKPNLKVGTSATIPTATITTANITTGNLDSGTADNFNVTNKLHATHFDLQSVAQLGGAFYVSPTIKFPTDSNTTFTITKSGATANIIISDSAITSTTLAGVVWGTNAKVKASGKIGTVTTGTMDGTVTGINTSNHTLTISVSGENSSSITAGTYTSADIDNFCVMMYNTGTYPVGIMMNSYGTDGRTYIDIHGGTSSATEPNVRIGNLGGLSFNGTTLPNQWGIYTNNGYFSGSIIANGGKIGGFTIGSTAIYTGTLTANSDNNIGLSSADFTRTIGGTSRSGLRFAIGDKVGITGDGVFYGSNIQVSGGKIGGWNIGDNYLYSQTSVTTGIASTQYGLRLVTGTSSSSQVIKAGSRSYDGTNYGEWTNKFYVRNDGYLYSTMGNIGGWTIGSNAFYKGTMGTTDGVFLVPAGSTGNYSIGGSESISDWTITSGANFGVTVSGAVYCSDIHATGEITATSGHIGTTTNGFTIDSSGFYSGTKTANNSGYIAMSNTTFSRTINSTPLNNLNLAIGSKFGVTSDGTLYANGLNIKNIDADNISIGTLSIERLTSLQIGGRNYFAIINSEDGYLTASGTIHAEDSYKEYTSDYIPVVAGECWSISTIINEGNPPWTVYAFYTAEKTFISPRYGGTDVTSVVGFVVPENAAYIRVSYRTHNYTSKCKLEKGNKITDWSPAPEDVDNSINQAQTTADTATTKIDNLKKPQLGWKINHSAYTQANNGECYFHGYDSNNAIADVDGKVDWNGEELTIAKGMWINPNQSAPYNTPILHVYRTSTAPYHADVWWDNDLGKWRGFMYKTDKTPDFRGDWIWDETTDCILATYIEPSADGEIQSAQLFNPPKKYSELPDPSVSYNLDNLEIGGRNLAKNCPSADWYTTNIVDGENKNINLFGQNNVHDWIDLTQIPDIKVGDTIQVSFDIKFGDNWQATGTGTKKSIVQGNYNGTSGTWVNVPYDPTYGGGGQKSDELQAIMSSSSKEGHINTYFKIIQNMLDGTYTGIAMSNIRFDYYSGSVSVRHVMVEKGTKPTNWTPAPEDVDSAISSVKDIADTALSQGVEYIVGTQTATTASWTGVTTDSTLVAGKTIAYKLPQTSASNATLNLTLSTGATTGAKAVYYNTTRVSTQYPANSIIHMTYDGSYWRITNYNSDTQNRMRLQNIITAAEAITAGHIICGTSSGYRDIEANVSFDLTYPLLYAATTKAKDATSDNNFLSINGINASNNGTITSGTIGKTLYLKGTVNDNTFTIGTSPFMTTVVPTTEDGLIYIPLGIMYSTTNIYFISSDKLYAYKDGGFKELSRGEASLAAKTATNYLYYDTTNGLVISSSASSQTYSGASTGYNTRLTNSALQIRNGTNVLASYGTTITIGQSGNSQQVIDSTSLKFRTAKGKDTFIIDNETIGEDYVTDIISLSPASYTEANIKSSIVDALDNYSMFSKEEDDIADFTTSNVKITVVLIGEAYVATQDGEIGYNENTEEQQINISNIYMSNNRLVATVSSTVSDDWTALVTELMNSFPSGATIELLSMRVTLYYPVKFVSMTLGTRNEIDGTVGIGSVSIGQNNIVSGAYSLGMGTGLLVPDDYCMAIGEGTYPILDETSGEREKMAFVVGTNEANAFGVSKTGTLFFSRNNCGTVQNTSVGSNKKATVTIEFPKRFPTPPFVLVSLIERQALNNQSNINDYGKIQIYVHETTQTSLTVFIINNGSASHTVEWSWFAFCTVDNLIE